MSLNYRTYIETDSPIIKVVKGHCDPFGGLQLRHDKKELINKVTKNIKGFLHSMN